MNKDIKMKLKLNKNKLKNLSQDKKSLPAQMTPQIAGGAGRNYTRDPRVCAINLTDQDFCFSDFCN